MRFKSAVLVTACLVLGLAPASALANQAPKHAPKPKPSYYLALGDSLAQGVQPNATGASVETKHGYADVLYGAEKVTIKRLKLAKLGCPGESTTSMINGGICHTYASGNQLADAVKFIKTHKIAFITLDIGANDVDACANSTGPALISCVLAGEVTIKANTPKIVKALRQAAGPKIRIAGMTYYDPFLAYYFGTPAQKGLAEPSVGLTRGVNKTLTDAFSAQKLRIADVATAFATYTPFSHKTTLKGHGKVPVAVARICQLTWMCAPKPRGPNIHADVAGYKKIAAAFLAQL